MFRILHQAVKCFASEEANTLEISDPSAKCMRAGSSLIHLRVQHIGKQHSSMEMKN